MTDTEQALLDAKAEGDLAREQYERWCAVEMAFLIGLQSEEIEYEHSITDAITEPK